MPRILWPIILFAAILAVFILSIDSSRARLELQWKSNPLEKNGQSSTEGYYVQLQEQLKSAATVTVVEKETKTVTATVEAAVPTSTAAESWKNPLALTRDECIQKFPGLFDELEKVARLRKGAKIKEKELDRNGNNYDGYARVLIYDQKMYVLEQNDEPGFSRRNAALHALHDAITTSPNPLPNIEFVINVWDSIENNVLAWSLTRKITQHPVQNNWLIPDFGLWSWPEPKVGSFEEVMMKSDIIDDQFRKPSGELTIEGKIDKAVWRGAMLGSPLRQDLFKVTKGKDWADVKEIHWANKEELKERLLTMADHCRYKYVLHVEGYSYSGRLKYLQTCHSIVIAHELAWYQHYFPLMQDSGPQQNYVKVKRDWSDLEEKIEWLQAHPEEADKIAARGRETMRKYQSQSANNCYWREMIRIWGEFQGWKPSLYNDGKQTWRGVPWESFALMKKVDWAPS